jgi:hypothetical protein
VRAQALQQAWHEHRQEAVAGSHAAVVHVVAEIGRDEREVRQPSSLQVSVKDAERCPAAASRRRPIRERIVFGAVA